MGTWQPLDSAPTDGRHVLLFVPGIPRNVWIGNYQSDVRVSHGVEVSRREGWNWAFAFQLHKAQPTHWMPLPDTSALEAKPRG